MRQAGRITGWNDAKGFGFVTPVDGGRRVFVHIKAFQVAGRRPLVGDLMSYDTATDAQGRVNATGVRFAGQRKAPAAAARKRNAGPRRPPRRIPRFAIGVLFPLGAVALVVIVDLLSAALLLGYAVLDPDGGRPALIGAIAFTIGEYGIDVLENLAKLVATFYLTSLFFVVVVLGLVAYFAGFSIFKMIRYLREELLLVLGTSSSEAALPSLMEKMNLRMVARKNVGRDMPRSEKTVTK